MPLLHLHAVTLSRRRETLTLVAALSVLLSTSAAHPRALSTHASLQDSVVVRLRSGVITLSLATTERFLRELRDAPPRGLHGLAAFRRQPTTRERRSLEARGIFVESPLQSRVYRVRAGKTFQQTDSVVRSLLLWLGTLRPEHRVAPDIWNGAHERYIAPARRDSVNYVFQPDSTLRLTIAFYRDVPRDEIEQLLSTHARDVKRISNHQWRAVVPRPNLRALAAAGIVRWIDAASPPFALDNDHTRGEVDVEEIQDFSVTSGLATGLAGRDIQIGVFDEGIDEDHDDLQTFAADVSVGNRVIITDPKASWHGTLVAGIIAGNGRRSDAVDSWGASNGAIPYQWRGMAPEAQLLDVHLSSFMDPDPFTLWAHNAERTAETVRKHIVDNGMDLSNHPYSLDSPGLYGEFNAQRDSMIRGDALSGGLSIPRRLQVFSAGNLGGSDGTGPAPLATVAKHGYFSVNKELKNGILVGSWRVTGGRVSGSSSLGPTRDGRIKPDIVAPGSQVKSTGYWAPGTETLLCTQPPPGTVEGATVRQQFYGTECGTSLAAPVVTGILALVLEKYAATYDVDIDNTPPLPSTLRALLVHSARDIEEPVWFTTVDGPVQTYKGPDFVTGFGIANAAHAVDLVAAKLLREDEILATCDTETFSFPVIEEVDGGAPTIRLTLAWDDVAADPATPSTDPRLVNDLDLVLVDPAGTRHYPWLRNQTIKSPAGTILSPHEQTCGTPIVVEPRLSAPGPVSAADLAAATTGVGPDHLNNVEQIVVEAATSGTWQAIVSGFSIEFGPQTFSLVGVPRGLFIEINPPKICKSLPDFCRGFLFNLCKRYPQLCEGPQIIPIFPTGPRITFRDRLDRAILPIAQLCAGLNVPTRCQASARVTSYEISVGPAPVPLGIEIYNAKGGRVAGAATLRRSARLALRPAQGGHYFLVLSPSAEVRPGRPYSVPIRVRELRR
jgi:subtilisin family serine protease